MRARSSLRSFPGCDVDKALDLLTDDRCLKFDRHRADDPIDPNLPAFLAQLARGHLALGVEDDEEPGWRPLEGGAHAVGAGRLRREGVAERSRVLLGEEQGRRSEEEITAFDSTGLAVQDLAVARAVYERYLEDPGAVPGVSLVSL